MKQDESTFFIVREAEYYVQKRWEDSRCRERKGRVHDHPVLLLDFHNRIGLLSGSKQTQLLPNKVCEGHWSVGIRNTFVVQIETTGGDQSTCSTCEGKGKERKTGKRQ